MYANRISTKEVDNMALQKAMKKYRRVLKTSMPKSSPSRGHSTLVAPVLSTRTGEDLRQSGREEQVRHPFLWINPYCWSHGEGGHTGEDWNIKIPDHRVEATATTGLVGSTSGFPNGLWLLGSPTSNIKITHNEINLETLANFGQTKNTCSGYPPTNL